MRILFIATIFSPLAARWIEQVVDTDWDIHVYGTSDGVIHPSFRNVTMYTQTSRSAVPEQIVFRPAWPFSRGTNRLKRVFTKLANILIPDPSHDIAKLIKKLKPDLIHTLKMQDEAYYVLKAKQLLGGSLPCPWIYSVWGSDIYFYQHIEESLPRIKQVLSSCDYLITDNPRDETLAEEHGFTGEMLGVFPTGGGYNVQQMWEKYYCKAVSQRQIIAIKGYQAEMGGQALMSLEAIARCGKIFSGYKIVIHSAIGTYASAYFADVEKKAQKVSELCDVPIEFLPYGPPEAIWELFGKSRIALAISNTDGTPNAMLEAVIMGAYPIQSNTGGLEEWINDGENGSLVPYDNPDRTAIALKNAVQNNNLIERAAQINYQIADTRLRRDIIQKRIIEIYSEIHRKHK